MLEYSHVDLMDYCAGPEAPVRGRPHRISVPRDSLELRASIRIGNQPEFSGLGDKVSTQMRGVDFVRTQFLHPFWPRHHRKPKPFSLVPNIDFFGKGSR